MALVGLEVSATLTTTSSRLYLSHLSGLDSPSRERNVTAARLFKRRVISNY